ncbi:PaaI family thioesterase [Roseomonas sp. CCTCC AB2023176]|uniref:PaaI family thioesterase n=1 Tax=Roseomonas sp. CCTCC AB2023176 TaxID=3342640 RepID=UPI0035D844B7
MFDPATAGWERRGTGAFSLLTGPFWARRDDRGWVYGLLAEDRHLNGAGIVHGGLLVTMADNALGLTVWEAAGRVPCVTVTLNTQFISAVHPGEFIQARAEILRQARSTVFVRGVLTVGDRIVAAADGVWKILAAPLARKGGA